MEEELRRHVAFFRPTEDLKSLKNGTMEDGRGLFCNVEQSIAEENRCMICRKNWVMSKRYLESATVSGDVVGVRR